MGSPMDYTQPGKQAAKQQRGFNMRGDYSNGFADNTGGSSHPWKGAPGIPVGKAQKPARTSPEAPAQATAQKVHFADLLAQAEAVQDRVELSRSVGGQLGQQGFLWQMLQAGRFRLRQAMSRGGK